MALHHRPLLLGLTVKVLLLCLCAANETTEELFEVICPEFEGSNNGVNTPTPLISQLYSRESNTDFCRCQLHVTSSGKTAIVKCDFEFKKNVKLTEKIFQFKKYEATSAYVRISNSKGAVVTSSFLHQWMQAPSSAIDIWSCGKVKIESALEPPYFEKIQTFIGTGIINSTIEELPSYFLRDRTRGAIRFKGCNIGKIKSGIFHNITEMRYFVIEDSEVSSVEGPLSTSGVIQLSAKSMHSWDGLEIINSNINHIAPFSFSISHKSDTEDFVIKKSQFGYLGTGAFNASGDIKVQISENTFNKMDSMAFKVSVNAPMVFEGNQITEYESDSLEGLDCHEEFSIVNNTLFVDSTGNSEHKSPFKSTCGAPKVAYLVKPKKPVSHVTISVVILVVALIGVIGFGLIYLVRTKSFILYKLKRNDPRLCEEEMSGDIAKVP